MKAHIHPPIVRWCFTTPARMSILKSAQLSAPIRVIELDGETFPYVTIDVSSKSHPYYYGQTKTFANEGSAAPIPPSLRRLY